MKTYETKDLNCATYLHARGFKLTDLSKSDRLSIFQFEETDLLKKAVLDCFNNGLIPNQTYWNSLRSLKNIIYGGKDWGIFTTCVVVK